MKKLFLILIIFIIPLVSLNAGNGEELIKKLQEKFETITDLSADFSQEVNGQKKLSGKIYFRKPEMLKLDMGNVVISTDGETTYNYNKGLKKVIVNNYDASDPSSFSIQKMVNEYPAKCIVEDTGTDNNSVTLVPGPDSGLSFNRIKLTVNKNNLIEKVEIDDPVNGLITVTFSNYKLNRNLPSSLFTITPPEGSRIIDLR